MDPDGRTAAGLLGGPRDLVDSYGRVHSDLRISITDRCNFRCTYCMPAEGMAWLDRGELLTFEEIERIARICVTEFGFRSIRLTGGEPTVRAHLPVLVSKLAALGVEVALTTNGATLALLADDLADAGLNRINISLDSLRAERFAALTGRDALDRVIAGIDAAVRAGLTPVKVNCVVVRGQNDDELVDLARFGRDHGCEMRFIEFMPLDAPEGWRADLVVSEAEMTRTIGAVFPLESLARDHQPARRYRYVDGRGHLGIIGSVSEPFCGSCDRVRLTAEGQLRNCLFAVTESDLRAVLRSGASDADIDRALVAALGRSVSEKWAGHGIGSVTFVRPKRSMSQIGG